MLKSKIAEDQHHELRVYGLEVKRIENKISDGVSTSIKFYYKDRDYYVHMINGRTVSVAAYEPCKNHTRMFGCEKAY